MPLVYDGIALGMWAYRSAAFRVTTLGSENVRFEPGTLLFATHRRETDVPVLCPSIYRATRMWANRDRRLSFSAREDMFVPGFLGGLPDLPRAARRVLFRVHLGPIMEERLLVFPLRSATEARLSEVLRAGGEAPLVELLPDELVGALHARARTAGLPQPGSACDAVRAEYGNLLWRAVTQAEAPGLETFWRARAARATADFRRLVELLRGGARLLVFPEGYPSATGEVGPLRRGLGALVRRGDPAAVQPIALAYDPLTSGRTRAYVAFGAPEDPPGSGVEEALTARLRRTMPLTVGQLVAARGLRGETTTARDLEEALDEARADGRPSDPALADRAERSRRLRDAIAAAERADLAYLAREYASARASRG